MYSKGSYTQWGAGTPLSGKRLAMRQLWRYFCRQDSEVREGILNLAVYSTQTKDLFIY